MFRKITQCHCGSCLRQTDPAGREPSKEEFNVLSESLNQGSGQTGELFRKHIFDRTRDGQNTQGKKVEGSVQTPGLKEHGCLPPPPEMGAQEQEPCAGGKLGLALRCRVGAEGSGRTSGRRGPVGLKGVPSLPA